MDFENSPVGKSLLPWSRFKGCSDAEIVFMNSQGEQIHPRITQKFHFKSDTFNECTFVYNYTYYTTCQT
jgi:hypothetical protein